MRLLGAVRLSDLTDESTSPERQNGKITSFAQLGNHELVYVAEDLDVSGAVSPFDRPDLGQWLDRPDDWDGIVVARLDRLTRSPFDFLIFWRWLEEHGKTLISLDPQLDFSTPFGRLVAQILVMFAEFERQMIADRVREAYYHLRQAGQFPGGSVPFGYMPIRLVPKGWRLVPDPELAPIVEEMVNRYLDGQSYHQISRWLNESGIPASRDTQRRRSGRAGLDKGWSPATVAKILTSPSLIGRTSSKGQPLRDSDGMLVMLDPLIPVERWERLQAAIEERKYGRREHPSLLLRVAFCACGEALYMASHNKVGEMTPGRRQFRYYLCQGRRKGDCQAGRIPADALEEWTWATFVTLVGETEILEPVHIPAVDQSAELAAVEEAMTYLEDQYVGGQVYQGAGGAARFSNMMARLQERRDRLAAMPSSPARTEYRPTGRTFAERWAELDGDPEGRRQLMISAGYKVWVVRKSLPGQGRQSRRVLPPGQPRRPSRPFTEVRLVSLDPDLARRAALAAADLPVHVPADGEELQAVLEPLRQLLRQPQHDSR